MSLSIKSTVRLSSGHYMPILGFGVYRNYDARTSCLQAFDAGYRHIDCAQSYTNENAVGQAVAASNLDRGDIFYTTKIMSNRHGDESTLIDLSLSKFDSGEREARPSDSRLAYKYPYNGPGYIDLFLIHDPYSGTEKRLATYKALLKARDAGKIRSVGVSNYGVHHLKEITDAGHDAPAVNQIEVHPFCQRKSLVKYCRENNIVVQAYGPLIQGMKGLVDHPTIMEVAEKHSRDNGQILIRWSLQKGLVPLPKSSNPARIISNSQVFDFELDEDDMTKLDGLDRGDKGAVSWDPVNSP